MNLLNWMSFDSFTHPRNHNHTIDIEYFHYYQKIPCVTFFFIQLTLEQYRFDPHGPLTCRFFPINTCPDFDLRLGICSCGGC